MEADSCIREITDLLKAEKVREAFNILDRQILNDRELRGTFFAVIKSAALNFQELEGIPWSQYVSISPRIIELSINLSLIVCRYLEETSTLNHFSKKDLYHLLVLLIRQKNQSDEERTERKELVNLLKELNLLKRVELISLLKKKEREKLIDLIELMYLLDLSVRIPVKKLPRFDDRYDENYYLKLQYWFDRQGALPRLGRLDLLRLLELLELQSKLSPPELLTLIERQEQMGEQDRNYVLNEINPKEYRKQKNLELVSYFYRINAKIKEFSQVLTELFKEIDSLENI